MGAEPLSLRLPANVAARVAPCRGDLLRADAQDPYVCAIDGADRKYEVVLVDGMVQ